MTQSKEPNSRLPPKPTGSAPLGPIVVSDEPKRKRKKRYKPEKPKPEPKNIFSDDTARRLLRWIKGKSNLPDKITLEGKKKRRVELYAINESTPKPPEKRDPQEELAAAIRERLFPWLFSFFVNACLLIVLALIFLPGNEGNPFDVILSGIGDEVSEFIRDNPPGFDTDINDLIIITPQNLPEVEMPKVELPKVETADAGTEAAAETESNAPPGLNFGPRQEIGSRANVLAAGGGTGRTDAAVVAGLRWLTRNQMFDGSWWLSRPYSNAAVRDRENRIAATALALLAFQGYGVTPTSTHPELVEFSRAVRMGWDWLLTQQNLEDDDQKSGDGVFFRDGVARNDDRFYTHGLCTIALCEVLAMTGDEKFREPARRAVTYCIRHQSPEGGWRYNPAPRSASDVSVTGWIVMALKSAEAAEIEVPRETYDEVGKFLDSVAVDGGSQYIYRPQEPGFRIAMNAEGLLCRVLLGWKQDDRRLKRGVELLVDPSYLPSFEEHYKRDVYHWYYATQVLHQYGGEPWKTWNARMRELLPEHQEQRGDNAGSWNPHQPVRDTWGQQYGRLYTTCLSLLILEVYYRHLRVYDR